MSKEAMKLALEALKELNEENSYWWQEVDESTLKKLISAEKYLEEALANADADAEIIKYHEATIARLQEALAKQEHGEPVLWAAKESMFMWGKSDESGHPYHIVCKGKKVKSHQIPLYTTPQQRTWERPWVSLTDADIDSLNLTSATKSDIADIEAKLKEKNGA